MRVNGLNILVNKTKPPPKLELAQALCFVFTNRHLNTVGIWGWPGAKQNTKQHPTYVVNT